MTKYILEVDIANEDDATFTKINKLLDAGAVQEPFKEDGIRIRQIAVRRDNDIPVLREELTGRAYTVCASLSHWCTVTAESPAEAVALACSVPPEEWELCFQEDFSYTVEPSDVYAVEANDDDQEAVPSPHDPRVTAAFGNRWFQTYAEKVVSTIDAMAPSESKWEQFDKLNRFINLLCERRAALLAPESVTG